MSNNFELKNADGGTLSEVIEAGCRQMEANLGSMNVKIEGNFNSSQNLLTIWVKAFDNEEIHRIYHEIFFEMLFLIPIEVAGKKYRFILTTYSDMSHTKETHKYHMETSMEKLPGTAQITRQDWNAFIGQLIHTKDGVPVSLEEPAPFYGDDPADLG